MHIDRNKYRESALSDPNGFNSAPQAFVQRAMATGKVWRVVCVHHLTGEENDNNHNVYADLVDEAGNFIDKPQERMRYGWSGQRSDEMSDPAKFDKSGNEPRTNVPVFKGAIFEVSVESEYPSDLVKGLTTDLPDEGKYNKRYHHSYYVIWQLQDIEVIAADNDDDDDDDGQGSESIVDNNLVSVESVIVAMETIEQSLLSYMEQVAITNPITKSAIDDIRTAVLRQFSLVKNLLGR